MSVECAACLPIRYIDVAVLILVCVSLMCSTGCSCVSLEAANFLNTFGAVIASVPQLFLWPEIVGIFRYFFSFVDYNDCCKI
jgi:hypothetical protein